MGLSCRTGPRPQFQLPLPSPSTRSVSVTRTAGVHYCPVLPRTCLDGAQYLPSTAPFAGRVRGLPGMGRGSPRGALRHAQLLSNMERYYLSLVKKRIARLKLWHNVITLAIVLNSTDKIMKNCLVA